MYSVALTAPFWPVAYGTRHSPSPRESSCNDRFHLKRRLLSVVRVVSICMADHGQVALGQLLISSRHAAAPLQPTDASFHHIPSSIRHPIQLKFTLIGSRRDHRLDAALGQPSSNTTVAVAFIAGDRFGTTPTTDLNGVHQCRERLGFVRLACGEKRAQRNTTPIGQKMKLRTKASARSSQGVVVGFSLAPFFTAPAAD